MMDDTSLCQTYMPYTINVIENSIPIAPVVSTSQNKLISNYNTGNQWYFDKIGKIAEADSNIYLPPMSGKYYAIVTLNGCESLPSNTIDFIFDGIKGIKASDAITVFPNPVSDVLKINTKTKINKIEIRDILGKLILRKVPQNDSDNEFTINMSEQETGSYIVSVFTNDGIKSYKILKIKN